MHLHNRPKILCPCPKKWRKFWKHLACWRKPQQERQKLCEDVTRRQSVIVFLYRKNEKRHVDKRHKSELCTDVPYWFVSLAVVDAFMSASSLALPFSKLCRNLQPTPTENPSWVRDPQPKFVVVSFSVLAQFLVIKSERRQSHNTKHTKVGIVSSLFTTDNVQLHCRTVHKPSTRKRCPSFPLSFPIPDLSNERNSFVETRLRPGCGWYVGQSSS